MTVVAVGHRRLVVLTPRSRIELIFLRIAAGEKCHDIVDFVTIQVLRKSW